MKNTNESQINQAVSEFISNHGYLTDSTDYLNQVENLNNLIKREGELNNVHYEIIKGNKSNKLRVKFL